MKKHMCRTGQRLWIVSLILGLFFMHKTDIAEKLWNVVWEVGGEAAAQNEVSKKIALTFDDGPHPIYTPELLEGLRERGVVVTFFVTGANATVSPELIEQMQEDGTFDVLQKQEVQKLSKELDKLQKNLGGIREMTEMPDMIFVVDPRKEHICIQEAHNLNIPLVGIVDTNCDPDEIDYVIPGNDDAIRAVKLIAATIADAVIEGNQGVDAASEESVEEAEEVQAEEE